MQKRGLTHADWIISMGIFILYVFMLIILLKPGYTEIYDQNVLLSIVKDNFNKQVGYSIVKVPLYIYSDVSGTYLIRIEDFPFNWNLENSAMTDDELSYIDFDFDNGLDFKARLNTGLNTFWLFNTQRLDYTAVHETAEWTDGCYCWTIKDKNPLQVCTGERPLIKCIKDKKSDAQYGDFDYEYGMINNIEGIVDSDNITMPVTIATGDDLNSLANECNTEREYADMKMQWGYPPEKEFRLYYVETDSPTYNQEDIKYVCNQADLADKSVSVKEWKDNILDEKAQTKGIIVNIGVW